MSEKSIYFDWSEVFARDKKVNVVVGARGIGKTFGMRLQLIRDYIKRGQRSIEIVRYKEDIKYMVSSYHERIEPFFPDYEFRSDSSGLYLRKKRASNVKAQWELYCYIQSLSTSQKAKRGTFKNVHRVLFDEFALDRTNRFERYLPSEVDDLARIISTASRERADGKGGEAPYAYLVGNAVDRFNPYYERWEFDADMLGITIKNGRLFYNVVADTDIYRGTTAHLVSGESRETKMASGNAHADLAELCKVEKRKPAGAVPMLGIKWNSKDFTLWRSSDMWHVENKKAPSDVRVVATRLRDGGVNVQGGKWLRKNLRPLVEMYSLGLCSFDKAATHNDYLELMEWIEV